MQQVCPMLLSAGRQPSPKPKNNKKMAYQSRSDLLLTVQALRPESEPGKLWHGFEPLTLKDMLWNKWGLWSTETFETHVESGQNGQMYSPVIVNQINRQKCGLQKRKYNFFYLYMWSFYLQTNKQATRTEKKLSLTKPILKVHECNHYLFLYAFIIKVKSV